MPTPLALSLAPFGLVTLDDKITVSVPAAPGAAVQLSVLVDCDGDGAPDAAMTKGSCRSPLVTRPLQLDNRGQAVGPLVLGELPEVKAAAAAGTLQLGIAVGRVAGEIGEVERVRLGGDACAPFASLVTGFGAACQPDAVSVLYSTRELRGSGAGYFPMYNRNKKSICLDLKNPEGLAVAKQLCQRADVVIENFRTGTMDKLGLGYAALSADNPRLSYCSE